MKIWLDAAMADIREKSLLPGGEEDVLFLARIWAGRDTRADRRLLFERAMRLRDEAVRPS